MKAENLKFPLSDFRLQACNLSLDLVSSLQAIFQQSDKEDFYEQSIGARRDLLQRYQ